MNTLTTLLKNLLGSKTKLPDKNNTKNSNTINPKKSKVDETKTDEISRNPVMDYSDARKDSRIGEELQKLSGRSSIREQQSGGELTEKIEKQKSHADAVKEAYEKGLIDGRNAKIEELYFPNIDDGIPYFRDTVSKESSSNIFSMARDA